MGFTVVADSVTGLHQNTWYDAVGNQVRVFTDAGWDPDGKNAAANPNYRLVDHVYTFDGANRITQTLNHSNSKPVRKQGKLISR